MSITRDAGGRAVIILTIAAAVGSMLLASGLIRCRAGAATGPFGLPRTGSPAPPPADGVIGWIFAKQAEFYREMSRTIRAAKSDGSAVWTLLAISFAYGIFHAAGPGHGKAVISSYLVANEETWRRGIVLSFASAMLQAIVAVAIVGIAAVLLQRDRRPDVQRRARHRDRQLCTDRAARRAPGLGQGQGFPERRAQHEPAAARRRRGGDAAA